ncbi:hypothetical protein DS745_03675 [Anaerobacillus alkaliphilus]|uniref:Group-specific protein n=1 Tax=Anaerobacillus alkaliphilus TaxID=1548597 RepID=A0A4Q0VXL2_9BACI|nr:hypothetical protein [Anaerobacillus alkaliphilus]RXJ04493.1 hypothetical protein DS745_03675 [Anaerobacillus alkaliphilus]
MVRKSVLLLVFITIFFNYSIINAENNKHVEILIIESDEIIKSVPINPNIQSEVEHIISKIDDVVKKFRPIPDKGVLMKIPLEPSININNQFLNTLIDEVIIIIPEDENPYLLVFDDENRSWFFTFSTPLNKLLKTLNVSL